MSTENQKAVETMDGEKDFYFALDAIRNLINDPLTGAETKLKAAVALAQISLA